MTKNDALLPCPWCDGKGIEKHSNDYEVWWYQCINYGDDCRGATKLEHSPEAALTAWNTRPTPAPLSKGDEADLKRLIFELIGEASVHCWDGDINAVFNSDKAKAIGEKAFNVFRALFTPSPVAVDAKAGDAQAPDADEEENRLVMLVKSSRLARGYENITNAKFTAGVVTAIRVLRDNGFLKALTAPKPDSAPQELKDGTMSDWTDQ